MKTNYSPGQTVFQVGIDFMTEECIIEPQTILFVGNEGLYVEGKSAQWGQRFGEQSLSLHAKNGFNKADFVKRSTCSLWTDTMEEAESFKSQIDRILEAKKQLLTA